MSSQRPSSASSSQLDVLIKPDVLSPVMSFLQKRLRNTRKRLRSVEELEVKSAAGRGLNADQLASLATKPALLAVLDELEKLEDAIQIPLAEELQAAKQKAVASIPPPAPFPPIKPDTEWIKERQAAVAAVADHTRQEAAITAAKDTKAAIKAAVSQSISSLIEILYFSNTFDMYSNYLAQMERHAVLECAAYQSVNSLTMEDLEGLVFCGRLATTRPYAPISHAEALEQCKKVAMRMVHENGNLTIQGLSLTNGELKSIVGSIKALDYVHSTPNVAPGMPLGHEMMSNSSNATSPPQKYNIMEVLAAAEEHLTEVMPKVEESSALDLEAPAPEQLPPPGAFSDDPSLGIASIPLSDTADSVRALAACRDTKPSSPPPPLGVSRRENTRGHRRGSATSKQPHINKRDNFRQRSENNGSSPATKKASEQHEKTARHPWNWKRGGERRQEK